MGRIRLLDRRQVTVMMLLTDSQVTDNNLEVRFMLQLKVTGYCLPN